MKLSGADYPVVAVGAVGVVSWVLPRINIIDTLGLNDYVVARNPQTLTDLQMAHERQAPPGYVECFDPNVFIDSRRVTILPRRTQMTPGKIVDCERIYAGLMRKMSEIGPASRISPLVKNPIDDPQFFIRQHYLDVLDRPPDPQGLGFWMDSLANCSESKSLCRADLSRAFFEAGEFRKRGFFIHSLYRVSFGRAPRFAEFMSDLRKLETYDVDDIAQEQNFLLNEWIAREEFRRKYPEALTAEEFVNRLFDSAGLVPFVTERMKQIESLRAEGSRLEVLRRIIESEDLKRQGSDPAFILTQYFIQLRRDASAEEFKILTDGLEKNQETGYRYVTCLMLTSPDYQRRFGPVVTRDRSECEH